MIAWPFSQARMMWLYPWSGRLARASSIEELIRAVLGTGMPAMIRVARCSIGAIAISEMNIQSTIEFSKFR